MHSLKKSNLIDWCHACLFLYVVEDNGEITRNIHNEPMKIDSNDNKEDKNSHTEDHIQKHDFETLNESTNNRRTEINNQQTCDSGEDKGIKGLSIEIEFQVGRNAE